MKMTKGFTLIEMLLVLVIVSMIIVMGIGYMQQKTQALRVDKTSLQMQQILNAGLAFYVVNGRWPATMDELQTNNFLPNIPLNNPWEQPYTIVQGPAIGSGPTPVSMPSLLYVYTNVTGAATSGSALASATMIVGKLPLAFATATDPAAGVPDPTTPCTSTSTVCYVTASVNIPGQNLNNASAVNFSGVYHHGACIPAPKCPVDAGGNAMTAQVFIVPISVSGVNDAGADANNLYPISSFTAYPSELSPQLSPIGCQGSTTAPVCTNTNPQSGDTFWRACLQVVTAKGLVSGSGSTPADPSWGQKVSLAAFTRCSINNEPSGSDYTTIFSN